MKKILSVISEEADKFLNDFQVDNKIQYKDLILEELIKKYKESIEWKKTQL